jgi:preprotein translocase subunit SecF
MIDWMKYRFVYLIISTLVIGAGVFGLLKWGLKIGVDFTGGSIIEYKFKDKVSTEDASKAIEGKGISVSSVQITGDGSYLFRFAPINEEEKGKIDSALMEKYKDGYEELRFENVGPAIGPELVRKTVVALILSACAILLWVAYQFKSIKFGTSAVLGMFHDSLVLIGSFSLLGHFFGAEVDFLFVTALLTILSFSVHDTIVNYDRLRELQRKSGASFYDLANKATTQTMVRSLNNSFTIIFMLMALMLLGGSTIKWFATALLIGTVSGTYSSPFVSVAILVTWDQIEKRFKLRRSK